ncbi:MAG: GWxTD domain-containing protein [Chloroherpetonaceae bacterium]
MMRLLLSLLFLIPFVDISARAQERYMDIVQKYRRPQFFAEFIALPAVNSDSLKLIGNIRLSYDNSFFVKNSEGKFATDLTFTTEVLQKNVAVTRSIRRKIVTVETHEETLNRTEFVETIFTLPLKKGDYEAAVEVTNNDLQKSLRMERQLLKLSAEPAAAKQGGLKASQLLFIDRPKIARDSLVIEPLGVSGNGIFGRDFLALLYIHLDSDSLREVSYQLLEKQDQREIPVSSGKLSASNLFYITALRESTEDARLIAERRKTATAEMLALIDFNAKSISNARYVLKVNAVSENGGVVEVKKEFDNAWINMPYPLYDIELAVRLMEGIMITSDEAKGILDGDAPEQRRKFLSFWKAQDPTPDTDFNEALEEFFRRVDYTFFNFYTNREFGWRTDRGRVYIRFGKPTEISREFPINRPTREIWIYKNLNKRFVFSDITNTGNYELVSESQLESE